MIIETSPVIEIKDSLDCEGDVELTCSYFSEDIFIYINENSAVEIMNHLNQVFLLDLMK